MVIADAVSRHANNSNLTVCTFFSVSKESAGTFTFFN